MKYIRVKREFHIQVNSQKVRKIAPGTYRIPDEIDTATAEKVAKWGRAEIFVEKKAPENKVAAVAENKAQVGGAAGDSGGAGSKPDARRGKRRKGSSAKVEGSGSTG